MPPACLVSAFRFWSMTPILSHTSAISARANPWV
jgi:hypothetical protein